jgi:hypothetical protein
MKTLPFRIYQKSISKYGDSYWMAEVHGFYDAIPFLQQTTTASYKGTATEVIKNATSSYFSFETNVAIDNSSQTWLCCKQTTRDFVTDVWLHSNIPNSFPGVTITKEGKFLYKDMIKTMSEDPAWIFTYIPTGKSNEVIISGSPEILNDTGLVNTITQSKQNVIYNMDSGGSTSYSLTRTPKLAVTSNLEEGSTNKKDGINYKQNSNVHDAYWQSYINNLGQLTFFSGVRAVISYNSILIDNMRVLDVAQLLDKKLMNSKETEGLYSGKYIISKIVRTIGTNKNLQTHVVLSRESLNQIRDFVKDQAIQSPTTTPSTERTTANLKITETLQLITQLLNSKNFTLNMPTVSLISKALNNILGGLFGINNLGIWLNMAYVLSSNSQSLINTLLSLGFTNAVSNNQAVNLSTTSAIIQSLNSGTFNQYISNGIITIPNVGSTPIDPASYTANMFAWYVSGTINTSSINTGDPNLDTLVTQTATYIQNDSLIPQVQGTTFRRFWGSLNSDTFNESDLKYLYNNESDYRFLSKIIPCKSNYIYILYPTYMREGIIEINGNVYTNYELTTKLIVYSGKTLSYYCYRTKDKFSNNVKVEVL